MPGKYHSGGRNKGVETRTQCLGNTILEAGTRASRQGHNAWEIPFWRQEQGRRDKDTMPGKYHSGGRNKGVETRTQCLGNTILEAGTRASRQGHNAWEIPFWRQEQGRRDKDTMPGKYHSGAGTRASRQGHNAWEIPFWSRNKGIETRTQCLGNTILGQEQGHRDKDTMPGKYHSGGRNKGIETRIQCLGNTILEVGTRSRKKRITGQEAEDTKQKT
ncbi:hypothetical protein NDU88_006039 [Pleurodeles waltl]|uniref:Uncharacterized protein n=1 Tax=Pleurodeles waltl TaxID=8319 RepID=A0AAV7WYW1_PLEWA|nr:hypothetical protein NDU88_006039 [Pleurodeles waltl]